MSKSQVFLLGILLSFTSLHAQVEEAQTGAWYMYFYNADFKESAFGVQGDIQYRNWNLLGDLEQLLLRSGLTYRPKNTNIKFTLGYANITTGTPDTSTATVNESRIYQEALVPQQIGAWVYVTHRFRYEQRFVENQDFRTRYRYNLFINVPFTSKKFQPKGTYFAFYNELFINGEQAIGNDVRVQFFDRNRTYLGLGYVISPKLKTQVGWMNQKTNTWGKGQLQFSLHHNF